MKEHLNNKLLANCNCAIPSVYNIFLNLHRSNPDMKKEENNPEQLGQRTRKIIVISTWLIAFMPLLAVIVMLLKANGHVPDSQALANPPDKQASIIYSSDGFEMGRFWSVNRKSIDYNQISPFVISALIATEDERFYDHAGVDFWGIGRALSGAATGGESGGASTISQQLAKLLYTLEDTARGGIAKDKWERLDQKFGENILAVRLEAQYTKEEIMTMYLNNFDFLYNAVGIASAAQVYFNTTPDKLKMEEAAMLVGMCKNPGMYNPLKFQFKLYDDSEDGRAQYELDSTRAYQRRNTVFHQWLKNSDAGNEHLPVKITQSQYDSLCKLPIIVDYQVVDHKEGIAPHFREVLREELQNKFAEKNDDGTYKYHKADGSPYNIYLDGLRIYTTIDTRCQEYAENAVQEHMETTLQAEFDKNNRKQKNAPFSSYVASEKVTDEQITAIMRRGMKSSDRYKEAKESGMSESAIEKMFNTPVAMHIFSYKGDFDTVMTPMDSIRYYKGILQCGLMSMDPQTGFVKAWVGGPDFNHFAYDHVKQAKRQVGSTIKPFIYAAAIYLGVVKPCDAFIDMDYCIDVPVSPSKNKSWCPATGTSNSGELITAECGLAGSLNNITVAVMKEMGATSGPQAVDKLLKNVGINLKPEEVVAAMCLGPMDLSLYDMVGAHSTWANKGIFIRPIYIMRVEDRNGNVIIDLEYEIKEAMPEHLAYTMVTMMKKVITSAHNPYNGKGYGTSGSLRSSQPWGGITAPTAGKTGTTNSAADGWFIGLTPDLVTGVWVGADDKQIHFSSYPWGQGARMALPIYGYYMQQIYKDKSLDISTKDFEIPAQYDNSIFNCTRTEQNLGPL